MKPYKLPEEIVKVITARLQDEFNAYYLYRAASNWCQNVGFFKAAEYFAKESTDELVHAKKIESFLVDWNVTPKLPSIPSPTLEFKDLKNVIESAYKIEYDLYEKYEADSLKVFELGDTCAFDLLQFFRQTQKDSVAEYSDMMNVLDGVDATKMNLLLLEEQLFE